MLAAALQRSAFGEVRRSPRFLALMLVMLVAAVGYGGRDAARLTYMTELTGDASGIGFSAALFAIGLAVGGLMSGPIADRFDPRRLLVAGMALQGVGSLVIGALLALGVIRLIDLGKAVDKCAEPRVSTDDDSTEGNTR